MDAVSEVKSRLNIEDVVGEYVRLTRSGRNYKGISPWTNEKTPSFIVSPEKQIWHDFSSGKGGDMFTFVMEMEGLDFKGALDMLARKAGVDLDQFQQAQSSGSTKFKARALEALEIATKFYQRQLTANRTALEYLIEQRQFSKQTLIDWRLGYAPNTTHGLTDFLTKQGFTTEEMKRAGIAVERQQRVVDMFRGRIMVPLSDSRGGVIGFTARLLDNDIDAPKYINTPQTITYDKSRNVFGLAQSKEAIRRQGYVVVVEGNLDVISSHQAGISNVVASAGTAMTEQHLRELKRFTGDIRLCFDADRAGISATERIIPLAQKVEVDLKVINLPDGSKDPDELVKKDIKAWQQAIDQATYATDWLINIYKSQLDLNSAVGKRAFTDTILPTIKRLRDPIEQEHYLKMTAQLTDSSLEAVQAKLSTESMDIVPVRLKKPSVKLEKIDLTVAEYQKLQDHFLAMVLMQPKLRDLVDRCREDYFSEGPARQLLIFIRDNPDFKGDPKTVKPLQEIGDYVKIIGLQFEELYQTLPVADLRQQAKNLLARLIAKYVKIQNQRLAEAMREASSEDEIRELIQKADKLNQLMK